MVLPNPRPSRLDPSNNITTQGTVNKLAPEESPLEQRRLRLSHYYHQIKALILTRQSAITGLLPASTAITAHGDYTDAWVRDNVYSILAVWGVAIAYQRLDDHQGRAYELEHSVIKLMRGLLTAMMRQSAKVERFKQTQHPLDAMHAKYDTHTGNVVVGDDEWGHLQLDATSLFLLMLAQMTASGLDIVQTLDEVNFIQNLVYYIGRTYRTPDYGIWERGNKINHGDAELNVSSIGMAKAALEALDGLNLFGIRGSQASVIHVLPDEVARSRITLESLLPRESNSKEVDSALLSVIGFPAFAVENQDLVDRTRHKVIDKLAGKYGCKRFLRDGHQTILEDTTRLHYEPQELRQFEHIECEWPLFFTYLMLDGLFRGDLEQAQTYQTQLQSVCLEQGGWRLLPELYYVPADVIEAEKAQPHSQTRLPNDNVPLIWAQSLWILGELLLDGLIELGDIDPLGRRLRVGKHHDPVVQVALLSETEDLQQELETYGIATQTLEQIEPIQVFKAEALAQAYTRVGQNQKLGLTGRPQRRLQSLITSCIFHLQGQVTVFVPTCLDQAQFYLTLDFHFLVDQIKGELHYIQRHWKHLGRPTLTLLITQAMLDAGQQPLLELFQAFKTGTCEGIRIQVGTLQQLMLMAGFNRIDDLHDLELRQANLKVQDRVPDVLPLEPALCGPLSHTQEFGLERETHVEALLSYLRQSPNLYEQIELLQALATLKGLEFDTGLGSPNYTATVHQLLDEVYRKAGQLKLWGVVRKAAGLTHKVDVGLSDAVTDILVRQKQISVGKSYSADSLIHRPMPHEKVVEKIQAFCGEDMRDRVLTQEILIYFHLLIKSEPQLFEGLLTLRVGYFLLLMTNELARELNLPRDEAYEHLMRLSPYEMKGRLRQALVSYELFDRAVFQQESLHLSPTRESIDWIVQPDSNAAEEQPGSWRHKRELQGMINRVPSNFYPRVWTLLQHCQGLIIGDKLERRNRLDSHLILSEMTPGEKNFALRVDHLLQKIHAPQYRQLNIEALMELAALVQANPNLRVEDYIAMDVLIGHGVRLAYLDEHPQYYNCYSEVKSEAWQAFYDSSPHRCAQYIADALKYLIQLGEPQAAIAANP